jgi:hypothetical protein
MEDAMDYSEKVAMNHLRFRGHHDVLYEPDGNVPPDFLVDRRIAVEVRRLGQTDSGFEPQKALEESSIPLSIRFGRLLASYGNSDVRRLISIAFRRPLPAWRLVDKGSRKFLDAVRAGTLAEGTTQTVAPNVNLTYTYKLEQAGDAFGLDDTDDPDWGGWIMAELERNLRVCIDEKTRKIAPHRSKYPEWWLVLVAQPVYAASERHIQQFRRSTRITHDWDKIVIVKGADHRRYFEL